MIASLEALLPPPSYTAAAASSLPAPSVHSPQPAAAASHAGVLRLWASLVGHLDDAGLLPDYSDQVMPQLDRIE